MASKLPTSWQDKIRIAIKRDPKRAGILGVLVVVLLVVGGKTLTGSPTPTVAKGSTPTNTRGKTDNAAKDAKPTVRKDAAAMRKWLAMPVKKLDRNLFAAKID